MENKIFAPCALTNPYLHWKKSTHPGQQEAMETRLNS